MRRKVIQIANSTQLISLPRKWALRFNIKKGDEVEITEKGNKLIVCYDLGHQHTAAEIDVSGLDRTSILYYIEILYRLGYDEIRVKFSSAMTEHYRLNKQEKIISVIHYVASRLIGMEIIQQKESFVVLKSLEQLSGKEFETAVKRIFILLQDASDDFIRGAEKADVVNLETIEEKHDSIAKFISYGMRVLNKMGSGDERNGYLLFHILNQLDKVADIIKYSARDLIAYNKPLSRESVDILKAIHQSIRMYMDFHFQFDKKKIKDIYLNRDVVIKKIRDKAAKLRPQELLICEYSRHMLEFLVDMTEARLGLEY